MKLTPLDKCGELDFEKVESKTNFIINNLILKMMAMFKDKFTLLCHTAELIYVNGEGHKSTKRVAQTMMIFAQMYNQLHSYQ